MIKPSDLCDGKTFERVPAAKLRSYLLSRGWRVVGRDGEDGSEFFYHDRRPVIVRSKKWMPAHEGYDCAFNIPREVYDTVEDPNFLVKIIPERYGDYGMHVSFLVGDLERHEDRWEGHILEDILKCDASSSADHGTEK